MANAAGLAWTALQRLIDASDAADALASLERHNGTWRLSSGHGDAQVPHTVGMEYLAKLLASPGTEVAVGELVGFSIAPINDEVLDPTALRSLRHRIYTLEATADSASLRGEPAEAAAPPERARRAHRPSPRRCRIRWPLAPLRRRHRTSPDVRAEGHPAGYRRHRPRLPQIAVPFKHPSRRATNADTTPVAGAPEQWNVRTH